MTVASGSRSARDLIVVGAGEHGRVVIDAALSRPDLFRILGYSDVARVPETERRFGIGWLGSDAECLARHRAAVYVLGVGGVASSNARVRLAEAIAGASLAAIVHREASVAGTADVAPGAVVFARAVVNTGAAVGEHVVVNTGAIIEHDVVLGAHAIVAPGAVIGGGARIDRTAYVGLGAHVRDHVRVGVGAVVGMGAVVTSDVPDGATVVGNPARPRSSR